MEDEKYLQLRQQYPLFVSKEQLYVICRISKRSAKYLLDNKIIPCEDTGKKTRRYRVALEDVIVYLKTRDKTGNTLIPEGVLNAKRTVACGCKASYSHVLLSGKQDELRRYYEHIFTDYPDALTPYDIAEMTGLKLGTVRRLIKSGSIRALLVGRQSVVPKEYMLDFIGSNRFLTLKSNSKEFQRILGGFSEWKAQVF